MPSGIYKITHLGSGKSYIGSSNNLRLREQQHFSSLRLGYHRNRYLQRAFDKYGEDDFKFEIIEYCPVEQLVMREQYWIDNTDDLYNLRTEVVESNLGVKWSEESKKKLAQKRSGENAPMWGKFGKDHHSSISVLQFDLDGNFIAKYSCAKEAARKTGINRGNISRSRTSYKTAGGFIWAYEDDSHKVFEMLEWLSRSHHLTGTKQTKERKEKTSKAVRGSNHPSAKLNDIQISVIRAFNLLKNKPTDKSIAKFFGIKQASHINRIRNNKLWKAE
jgi:hypothetical protein